jgi:hypothetical protein
LIFGSLAAGLLFGFLLLGSGGFDERWRFAVGFGQGLFKLLYLSF